MKKYWIELICSFFLVLVIGMTGDPMAIGITLVALVYMGGPISAAHFNPAITLVFLMRKKINIKEALWYIGAEVTGALLAAAFYYLVFEKSFFPAPSPDFELWRALLVECIFTFLLASVILYVALFSPTAGNSYYGIAIGFTVLGAAAAGGSISGGAFNPAVGLGPIIIDSLTGGTSYNHLWLYIVGPFSGSILAAIIFSLMNPEEN
ncbi:MAG: aquaporin [Flavobacteriales bacterium]|nr:aquaporin [Flavobacteriales bacterium]